MSDYDYELPPDRIAQIPLEDRAASRMLHLDRATGEVHHRAFRDLAGLLKAGDLLVLNETRVTAFRLYGKKPSGGKVEMLLLRELIPGDYAALVKPGRRLPPGQIVQFEAGLMAEIGEPLDGPERRVRLFAPGVAPEQIHAMVAKIGRTPLPPYIQAPLAEAERYQTVFSRIGGSAAAPTAGLHFTPEILAFLEAIGIGIAKVVLDVSLDTFRPVEADDLGDHVMHGEQATLTPATQKAIADCRGRIIAVGTTVVRTLESFATAPRHVDTGTRTTRLFIRPGYAFQIVDGLLTNFHMPRTTMLVLVSSFAGRDRVLAAYQEALQTGYRFLSFGDAMLVI